MRPRPAERMPGSTSWHSRTAPNTFVSNRLSSWRAVPGRRLADAGRAARDTDGAEVRPVGRHSHAPSLGRAVRRDRCHRVVSEPVTTDSS